MATNVPSSIPTLDGDGDAGFERERKEEKRRHMLTMMEKRCYSANCTFKSFILLRFFDRRFHAQQYKAQSNAHKNQPTHDGHDSKNLRCDIAFCGYGAAFSSSSANPASKALRPHYGYKRLLRSLRRAKTHHIKLALWSQSPERLESPHAHLNPSCLSSGGPAAAAIPPPVCCHGR